MSGQAVRYSVEPAPERGLFIVRASTDAAVAFLRSAFAIQHPAGRARRVMLPLGPGTMTGWPGVVVDLERLAWARTVMDGLGAVEVGHV